MTLTMQFLTELFAYSAWARDRLFDLVAPLSGDRLDRPFAMGPGTIRDTMHHLWAAERVWLDRWTGGGAPALAPPEPGLPISELRARAEAAAAERDAFLSSRSAAELEVPLAFTNTRGERLALPLGGQMLHVVNHGIHHRAQVVNMLRRVGAALPKSGLDYIFYRLEKRTDPPPPFDLPSIRVYQQAADWATRTIIAALSPLTDAQLDRSFEMGLGSLRKTLCHLWCAETWWHTNWTAGPAGAFPPADEVVSVRELAARLDDAWAARDRFVNGLTDADLARPITTKPRPDLTLQFPLGVSLVQLCGHATHHRAQMLNMLRHVGAPAPALDLILWLRSQ